MTPSTPTAQRRFIVPEVVQTSAMDCGPAALKSLLEGFGVSVSYGRLREACQTDVDGTSIDTLEEIAMQLGLEAEQIMVPLDHVLLPQALPAIIVVLLPNGFTHFVVAWRCHARRVVQIMDPATGRRWSSVQQFLDELYVHTFPVPAAAWPTWVLHRAPGRD
jgi:ABC-type bacteriocin/lantibiotic exporter with double-glycine peptidase domain